MRVFRIQPVLRSYVLHISVRCLCRSRICHFVTAWLFLHVSQNACGASILFASRALFLNCMFIIAVQCLKGSHRGTFVAAGFLFYDSRRSHKHDVGCATII